jgi:hypothetical protein
MILFIFIPLLSLWATAIMAYVSMATSIGPWIAPTLLLLIYALYGIAQKTPLPSTLIQIVAGSSPGGIAATAFGFSFPALFFLDQNLYQQMVSTPLFFISLSGGIVLLGGWLGLLLAQQSESYLHKDKEYPFPVGKMIFSMARKGHDRFHHAQLWIGTIFFALWTWIQSKMHLLASVLPLSYIRFFSLFPTGNLTVMPMLLSVGFVAGKMLAIPLLTGTVLKVLLLQPFHATYYSGVHIMEFFLAFCTGMVLCGVLHSLTTLPSAIKRIIERFCFAWSFKKSSAVDTLPAKHTESTFSYTFSFIAQAVLFIVCFMASSFYLGLSFIVQLYVIVTTYFCVHQMIVLGGTMGIVPLGRFATFVMVPALFLFSLDYVQLIAIATFVEVAGGVAVDALFAQKAAQLASMEKRSIQLIQYIGICLAALFCGIIFLLLSSKFQIGSAALGAYKAQARALLVHAHKLDDYLLVGCGLACGWILSLLKINPSMVLGGILMPLDYSLGLIVGGMCTYLVPQKEQWLPFASAIFAANSLWMIIKAVW